MQLLDNWWFFWLTFAEEKQAASQHATNGGRLSLALHSLNQGLVRHLLLSFLVQIIIVHHHHLFRVIRWPMNRAGWRYFHFLPPLGKSDETLRDQNVPAGPAEDPLSAETDCSTFYSIEGLIFWIEFKSDLMFSLYSFMIYKLLLRIPYEKKKKLIPPKRRYHFIFSPSDISLVRAIIHTSPAVIKSNTVCIATHRAIDWIAISIL